ncbi:hypothetical protein AFULGI_00016700 [Archaeoglobus fulgidus DSM 8774]|uniref:Uncharacterized protein n=1 Tax=Archaeoglobus fulgidus DSM 8774 TaxID=1344584 RepID=A0A075WH63_ARCFL|nr:hypothetical protein AFULGI_00016700 [Archaeoglobus fulgidus DSM 8774]
MEAQPFEIFIKTYKETVDEVVYETFKREGELATSLFELLSNWIDLSNLIKEYKDEWYHTLSGNLFVYLWRGYGWIIYEVLSGHYFEALKDMRFLFEGALLSLHFEHFIDKKIYEKCGSFGGIGLKTEILELVESLREVGKGLLSEDTNKVRKAKRNIRKKVKKFIENSSLSDEEKREYIELYSEILCQPELYWSVGKIIRESGRAFNLDKRQVEVLEKVWSELSSFTHFSSKFFGTILRRPELLLVNDFDEVLFKKCVNLQFLTFDVLCAVLAVHFPKVRVKLWNVLRWWEENANRRFEITEGVLKSLS